MADTFTLKEHEFTYADILLDQNNRCLTPRHTKATRNTERRVEVSLGYEWANKVGYSYWEVGAVMAHYFPELCDRVVDPHDGIERVTHKCSLFAVDFTGASVLSISTIEHVGTGDYRLPKTGNAVDALLHINQAERFLITIPLGYNKLLDGFLFSGKADGICKQYYLKRDQEKWFKVDREQANIPYIGKGRGAGALAVLEKGNVL